MADIFPNDPLRWASAGALLLAYIGLCVGIYRQQHRLRQQAADQAALLAGSDGPPVLVAYASQTGQAQALAEHCAQQLHAAGWAVTLQPLNQTTAAQLQAATHAILIASTYGEGDAPDNAALFQRQCMAQALPLHQLRYSLLALGDSQYAQFCGFGRALDGWLQAQHAQPLHARIEVDQAHDSASALADWQAQLAQALHLQPSTTALPTAPSPTLWTLAARSHLNPGSQGGAVYHLEFQAQSAEAQAQRWQSGDLVDLAPPQEPTVPRSYSIASIPEDGRLHLLVRQTQRSNGTPGRASHWLTQGLAVGESLSLLLRSHTGFRLEENAQRPLILIGNGTGLAGLRAHLRARQALGQHANWLIAGERQSAHDQLYGSELQSWLSSGHLQRLDWAFSRDGARRTYVQDLLHAHAPLLRQWVHEQGAALYVCGSLQGMAPCVDAALRSILGNAEVDALLQQGRYRRDVY